MMILRAALTVVLALGLLNAPLVAGAQPSARPVRIGWLSTGPHPFISAFRAELRDLGYVEGQTVVIEERYAEGHAERLPALADELLRVSKVNVVVTSGSAAGLAAKKATTSIPIVSVTADLVAVGLVQSLGRPGGNVTGLALVSTELSPKWLQLLKEAVPGMTRAGVLWDSSAAGRAQVRPLQAAAPSLSIGVVPLDARDAQGIELAFGQAVKERVDALVVMSSTVFAAEKRQVITLAAKHRLPVIYEHRDFVDAGGLMSYGPDLREVFHRAAIYVDKILKGTKPADLPVEQPKKFEFVINLKTAKVLGLAIPQSLLLRADQIIE